MSNEEFKPTDHIEVASNASEIGGVYGQELDDFVSGETQDILRRVGAESFNEVFERIRTGEIGMGEATFIQNRIKNLLKYKESFHPSDLFYYPRGKPAIELENVEGRKLEMIEGIRDVWSFQVLPNGDIVSGDSDGKITLWVKRVDGTYDVGNPIEVGRHDSGSAHALQVLLNGDVVSGTESGEVKLWKRGPDGTYDVDNPIEAGRHSHGMVSTLQVLPNGDVVSGGVNGEVILWTRKEDGTYDVDNPIKVGLHTNWVFAIQVLPDGAIVSAGADGKILLWRKQEDGMYDIEKPTEVGHCGDAWFGNLQVLPSGEIVSWDNRGVVSFWSPGKEGIYYLDKEVGGERNPYWINEKERISSFQLLPNGDLVWSGDSGKIKLLPRSGNGPYDYDMGQSIEIGQHKGVINDLQVLTDGDIMFIDANKYLYILRQNKDD